MPCWRHSSVTATPPSAAFKIARIWLSVNRLVFIVESSVSEYSTSSWQYFKGGLQDSRHDQHRGTSGRGGPAHDTRPLGERSDHGAQQSNRAGHAGGAHHAHRPAGAVAGQGRDQRAPRLCPAHADIATADAPVADP